MRLICPNCGAQYEVADDVIPENGRDVQCSNCGHTWLEKPGASAEAEDQIEDHHDDAIPQDWDVDYDAEPPAATDNTPSEPTEIDDEDGRIAAAPTPPGTQDSAPQRQSLDPSVAEILKEEAAREQAAREAERDTGLESQGDLGLDEGANPLDEQREQEARDRIARLKGEENDLNAAVAATVASSRKELLPDIEDINATLRPGSERADVDPLPEEVEEKQRRGFRFGFLSVMGGIIVLSLIYLFADQIAEAVPALKGALDSYVAAVDNLRIWLDVKIKGLLVSLEGSDA